MERNTTMNAAQDQQSRELLPCPFCGQQDAFVEQLDTDASVVICDARISEHCACLARGPVAVRDDEDEMQPGRTAAIAAWNRRAPVEQAARALPARGVDPMLDTPAGIEPVARVCQGAGANIQWRKGMTYADLPAIDGQDLYTAAQVQGMGRVPPEWQAVPMESTRTMKAAGRQALKGAADCTSTGQAVIVFEAMCAAAPRPPAAPATTEPQAPTTGAGSASSGAAPQLIVGPCGQCKDDRQPCSCAIDTMLKERGQIAVNRERHLAMAKQAKAAQERKPLTDEQVQDLIGFGDPTEQERYLVCLGWNAAHGIK